LQGARRQGKAPLVSHAARSLRLKDFARREWAEITRVNPSNRPWQMPFVAGITSALPVALAAWLGDIHQGLVAALGTMVFVYIADTTLERRLLTLMGTSFAITACYALGLVAAQVHLAAVPVMIAVATLVSIGCRYLRQGPPAAMFPVMAAAIGLFANAPWTDIPARVGMLFMGAMLATATGFFYSVYILSRRSPAPRPVPAPLTVETLLFEPVMIGLAAGLALAAALALRIDKPFWAPVSAIAVIQAATLRSVWTRQVHRIVGTAIGVGLAALILRMGLVPWQVVGMVGLLTFVIEVAVVRHYGFAVMFITPLAILLGQPHAADPASVQAITLARLEDTLVGCVVAVAVGLLMHWPALRGWVNGAWGKAA
jgi:uncharacterized membrane protein YccC